MHGAGPAGGSCPARRVRGHGRGRQRRYIRKAYMAEGGREKVWQRGDRWRTLALTCLSPRPTHAKCHPAAVRDAHLRPRGAMDVKTCPLEASQPPPSPHKPLRSPILTCGSEVSYTSNRPLPPVSCMRREAPLAGGPPQQHSFMIHLPLDLLAGGEAVLKGGGLLEVEGGGILCRARQGKAGGQSGGRATLGPPRPVSSLGLRQPHSDRAGRHRDGYM